VDWAVVMARRRGLSGGDDREDGTVPESGSACRVMWTQWR
jgi:hypothetical protein